MQQLFSCSQIPKKGPTSGPALCFRSRGIGQSLLRGALRSVAALYLYDIGQKG